MYYQIMREDGSLLTSFFPDYSGWGQSAPVTLPVAGGTNANGSTHQISITLVGAGTNFPADVVFSGSVPEPVTNLTVAVSATGPDTRSSEPPLGFSTLTTALSVNEARSLLRSPTSLKSRSVMSSDADAGAAVCHPFDGSPRLR